MTYSLAWSHYFSRYNRWSDRSGDCTLRTQDRWTDFGCHFSRFCSISDHSCYQPDCIWGNLWPGCLLIISLSYEHRVLLLSKLSFNLMRNQRRNMYLEIKKRIPYYDRRKDVEIYWNKKITWREGGFIGESGRWVRLVTIFEILLNGNIASLVLHLPLINLFNLGMFELILERIITKNLIYVKGKCVFYIFWTGNPGCSFFLRPKLSSFRICCFFWSNSRVNCRYCSIFCSFFSCLLCLCSEFRIWSGKVWIRWKLEFSCRLCWTSEPWVLSLMKFSVDLERSSKGGRTWDIRWFRFAGIRFCSWE